MIANQNRTPSLDDVLAEIAASPVPPDAQQLRWWMNRYPEFRAEILDFATDWIEMEAAKSPHKVTKDEVDLVVNRTMSRVQQLLDKAERPTSMKDLLADIKSAGHDFESFQRAVGIDRSMLTCLAERMIRPATIPLRLVTAMALALNRTVEVVRDYLLLPPQPAAAYKARTQPESKQVDFVVVVECAELSDTDKARWLTEAPDPDLRA
jgi:hypothetical protein